MERILIIGCGGSGKSTLSRQLGALTGLPVVHLDQIFWSPGHWVHLEREEFDRLLAVELEKPRWIMDGNYDRTLTVRLERADTVVYLDYTRFVCLRRWLKRVVTNWKKARPDMAPGCAEWFDPEFAGWIWNFNKAKREKYHALLAEQTDKNIYIFKKPRQLKKFLRAFSCNSTPSVL